MEIFVLILIAQFEYQYWSDLNTMFEDYNIVLENNQFPRVSLVTLLCSGYTYQWQREIIIDSKHLACAKFNWQRLAPRLNIHQSPQS